MRDENTGTFGIAGPPHSGAYTQCVTSAFTGGVTTLSCTGLTTGGSDCTVVVSSVSPSDLNNPFGHFTGTITASLYPTYAITHDCMYMGSTYDQYTPQGEAIPISTSGGW